MSIIPINPSGSPDDSSTRKISLENFPEFIKNKGSESLLGPKVAEETPQKPEDYLSLDLRGLKGKQSERIARELAAPIKADTTSDEEGVITIKGPEGAWSMEKMIFSEKSKIPADKKEQIFTEIIKAINITKGNLITLIKESIKEAAEKQGKLEIISRLISSEIKSAKGFANSNPSSMMAKVLIGQVGTEAYTYLKDNSIEDLTREIAEEFLKRISREEAEN